MPLTPLRLRHPRRLAAQAVDRARVFDTLVNNLEGMAYRCLIDPQWTMVFVSQGCMALTGYAPSELSGDGVVSWEQITHPHDRMRVRAVVQAAGVNRNKVNEILKAELGFTFTGYLNKLRLTEAARLLAEKGSATVSEIVSCPAR